MVLQVLTFIALKLCSIFILLPNIQARDIFISVYFGLCFGLSLGHINRHFSKQPTKYFFLSKLRSLYICVAFEICSEAAAQFEHFHCCSF